MTARALHASDAASAASRIRLRRALTLVAMTVVAPGTAQLVAGNKRVGRIAMRCAMAGALFVVVLVLLGLFWKSELVALFVRPGFLLLLRVGLILYGLGWAYLVIDAWRISEPLSMRRGHRLMMTALNGTLCFALSGALLFASHLVAVQRDFIQSVFGGDEVTETENGRYNILLLGGDAGPSGRGCVPTASRSPASTRTPVAPSCSGCRATSPTCRSPPARRCTRSSRTASTARAATSTA